MERVEVAIIGAGVVGLAIAARLSGRYQTVVLEKNRSFGGETSSRNSEVIHAGIYYPPGTLKARLCVAGNSMLYAYCQKHGIPHQRMGKLIVAADDAEIAHLKLLAENGRANGVVDLQWLEAGEVASLEPAIRCQAGLLSPSTGIFDTHRYLARLAAEAHAKGALIAYASEVTAIGKEDAGYRLRVGEEELKTAWVINGAGLNSEKIAALAGIDTIAAGYRLHYCKGDYFRTTKALTIQRLIYPVPGRAGHGLGIHLTQDLAGGIRFGPDTEYVDRLDYAVDPDKRAVFTRAIQKYLPALQAQDLYPDTSGVRPKLQGPGEGFRDFVIKEESARGLPQFINLIGIESPGLTASLAIAEYVAGRLS